MKPKRKEKLDHLRKVCEEAWESIEPARQISAIFCGLKWQGMLFPYCVEEVARMYPDVPMEEVIAAYFIAAGQPPPAS